MNEKQLNKILETEILEATKKEKEMVKRRIKNRLSSGETTMNACLSEIDNFIIKKGEIKGKDDI